MRRRILVVANPAAGLSRRARAADRALAALRRAEPRSEVDLARTTGPGDARRLAAAAAAEGFDVVAAVGGDGTAHEVGNGLAGTATALGVVPAGTMNLLARVLSIPLDPEAAAARIALSPRTIEIAPGEAGDRLFLLMAGAGFDAWVLRALLAEGKGKIGFVRYALGALRGMSSYPFPRLRVRAGDRVLSGHSAIVGRAPLYGGFLRPTPRAALDAPELELCLFSGGAGDLLRALPFVAAGAHGARHGAERVLGRVFEFETDGDALPLQLDGELAGSLPRRLGIASRKLRLVAGARGR